MKSYTLIGFGLLGCASIGVILSLVFLEPAAQLGGMAISCAVFGGPAGSFFVKRKFDKREINFSNKEKKLE